MRAFSLCVAAAAVLAVAAAGCGDDSSEQLSADELVTRADEICAGGIDEFTAIQADSPSNAKEAEAQTSELVEVATDELSDLRELRPPEELRDPYEAYLEARGRALEQLERGRDAAADRDTEAYVAAQTKVTADQPQRIKLAKKVGLKTCSEPGAPGGGTGDSAAKG